MELKQLRYFIAVAEMGSITNAAERLNLTQPALGQQIRNLEDQLGFALLRRHSRGVALTEAGLRFRRHAEDILERVAMAGTDMQRFSSMAVGRVGVGVTPSIGRWLVPALLEAASDRYPEITLQFTQGFTDQLDELFDAGALELSVSHTSLDTERHETIPLVVEEIGVIGRPSLLTGLTSPVPSSSLAALPIVLDQRSRKVRALIDTVLREEGTSLVDIVDIHAINIRRELVLQGKRCSIAPPALFEEEIRAGALVFASIDEPRFTRTVHLASGRLEVLPPSEAAVRSLVVEIIDRMTAEGRLGWRMPRLA